MSRRRRARRRPQPGDDRRRAVPDARTMPPEHRMPWATLVVVIVLAALVRLLAARGDLWLDEIFTVNLVRNASSPLAILTELRHENNHVLNTFFVYLLRPLDSDYIYRLPAWAASVATVAIGAWVAWLGDGRG